jgi:hypothetical protein
MDEWKEVAFAWAVAALLLAAGVAAADLATAELGVELRNVAVAQNAPLQ